MARNKDNNQTKYIRTPNVDDNLTDYGKDRYIRYARKLIQKKNLTKLNNERVNNAVYVEELMNGIQNMNDRKIGEYPDVKVIDLYLQLSAELREIKKELNLYDE